MNILMIGSGAYGSFVGSRLIENGVHVTFCVRPERQQMLLTSGLTVRTPSGSFRRPVRAITVSEIKAPFDVVIVAVRANHYEAALAAAASAIGPQTVIIPLVEGIAQFQSSGIFDDARIVRTVFEGRLWVDGDGVIRQRGPRAELCLGPVDVGHRFVVDDLIALFTGRGLTATLGTRIRAKAFERFAFVAAAAATSTLFNMPLRDTRHVAMGKSTFEGLLETGRAIGVAAGFDPDVVRVRSYQDSYLFEGRPVAPPALIQDGGASGAEIVHLLGQMVSLGREHRVLREKFESAWRRATERMSFFDAPTPPSPRY